MLYPVDLNLITYTMPLIFSFLINGALYGALCAQVYLYYLTFPEDRPSNKVLVYSVFIMETMQTILLLYHGILMYSDPYTFKYLFSPAWSFIQWTAIPLLGGIVALAVQTFYAYRLHILACSWAIMILVILLLSSLL
ncbi:hypothetical protein L208DRAFT_912873 [Tricholoma matsutake]|nr:hypothetical protein L208DRAFT_912873 [Tricholoma matsutake 945]